MTCTNPDEKVTSTSTKPTPEATSRIAEPLSDSLVRANTPNNSCPSFSGRRFNLPLLRESQKEFTASASIVFLNSSRNVRIVIRERLAKLLPEVSTLFAIAFETKNSLFF
jgi:hypothetical protein